MGKLVLTVVSVVVAVGTFTGLWVGVNRIFDQVSERFERFSMLVGGIVGFCVFAVIDGNRALQTIGPRNDVRDALYFGRRDDITIVGNIVGLLWWAIPGAVIVAALAVALAKSADPTRRLAVGTGGGAAIGVLLGIMTRTSYLPGLDVVPAIVLPVVLGAIGYAINRLRGSSGLVVPAALATLGWTLGSFGGADIGGGSRVEAIIAFAVAFGLAGATAGVTRRPDANRRTSISTGSRSWIFMGPALLFISATLIIPGIITAILSLKDNDGDRFVGLENYGGLFRADGEWNDNNFDLAGWADIFGSRLLYLGIPLIAIGLALAAVAGRRVGRTLDVNPQSGGLVVSGVVLIGFAVFSALRGTIFNNLWWVFAVTLFATGLGLAIANLTDGIRGERVAKSLIFMPMAISFVGAGIIWRFMYRSQDISKNQTGFLNAAWVWLGSKTAGAAPTDGDAPDYDPARYSDFGVGIGDLEIFHFNAKWLFVAVFAAATAFFVWRAIRSWPTYREAGVAGNGIAALIPAYLAFRTATEGIGGYERLDDGTVIPRAITFLETGPFNNFWLMVVLLWIETGFAMVILSAAIKAVPGEYIEAAKIDGADDSQIFWRITVPQIAPTIGVVVTTIIVRVTKVYDIVKVMTGGNFDTNVLANEMISQAFSFGNSGTGSALAIVLFLSVLPIMYLNIRRMQREAA